MSRTLIAILCAGTLAGATAPSALADTTVADNGFRPNPNGFSFENYGGDQGFQNLTPIEVQKLFGPAVCANGSGAKCTLSPPAKQWMDSWNKSMNGGHCYGFSVLAEQLWKQTFPAFGPGSTFSYTVQGNTSLQRSIAYAFSYQGLESVLEKRIIGTPNQILDKLKTALTSSNPETYTVAFFKRDGSGGHGVTPYAVVDQGGGKFGLQIYDNNYPGETRTMSFNTTTDTWSYNAAINPTVTPELYEGDAKTQSIMLYPTTPGIGTQPCPFCQPERAASAAGSSLRFDLVQLLDGSHNQVDLQVHTPNGVIGVEGGKLIDKLAHALLAPLLLGDFNKAEEPNYLVPEQAMTIVIDGAHLHHAQALSVSSISPGKDEVLSIPSFKPGARGYLYTNASSSQIAVSTGSRPVGSPVLRIGADETGADYALTLRLVRFHPGAVLHVKLSRAKHLISFYATGNPGSAAYVLSAVKETRKRNMRLESVTAHLHGSEDATYSYNKV